MKNSGEYTQDVPYRTPELLNLKIKPDIERWFLFTIVKGAYAKFRNRHR